VSTPSAQMHVLKDSDGPHTAYVLRPTSYFQHLLKDVISPAHSPCRAGAALRFISRGSSGCLGDYNLPCLGAPGSCAILLGSAIVRTLAFLATSLPVAV